MAIIIRDAAERDFSNIRQMLQSVGFDHFVDDQIWQWEFLGQREKAIIKIAYDDQRGAIAGHYAMLPLEFTYQGRLYVGGKIEGSAVAEQYRGKNLLNLYPNVKGVKIFRDLVRAMVHQLSDDKIDIVFGFPNEAAKKTQYLNGFTEAEFNFAQFIKVFNSDAFINDKMPNAGRVRRAAVRAAVGMKNIIWESRRRCSSCEIVEYDARKHDLAEIAETFLRRRGLASIRRSESYLKWRHLNNPVYCNEILAAHDVSGRPCGAIAYGLRKRPGITDSKIDDLISSDNDTLVMRDLIQAALVRLKERGADYTSGIVVGDAHRNIAGAYAKCGFLRINRHENNFFYLSEKLRNECPELFCVDNWFVNYSFRQF